MNFKKKIIITLVSVVGIAALGCGIGFGISASSESGDTGEHYLSDSVIDIANGSDDTLGVQNDFNRYEDAYDAENDLNGTDYEVQFGSGGADHTHQYIVANVLLILANDQGNSIYNSSTNSTLLLEGTDWPDSHDRGFIFDSHFYNPYTEKNFAGGSTTAKTKAADYYSQAVTAYKKGDITSAMQYLGRGSHFVSDACEPHHATNLTAVNSIHSKYESYLDDNRNSYKVVGNTFDSSVYEEALSLSVTQIVRNNSYASYTLKTAVESKNSSKSCYADAGKACVINAMMSNAQYFYKFGKEVGIYK